MLSNEDIEKWVAPGDRSRLAHEFLRRLRHQCDMLVAHDSGGCTKVACFTLKLLSCGMADSWTTLAGIGFAREAQDLMDEYKGKMPR